MKTNKTQIVLYTPKGEAKHYPDVTVIETNDYLVAFKNNQTNETVNSSLPFTIIVGAKYV